MKQKAVKARKLKITSCDVIQFEFLDERKFDRK